MPWPAMSGAEPCTGSNIEGNLRSGLMLADGAMPIVPVQAGPRSERMSPNRLEPTTTSNQSGLQHEMRRQDVDVVLVDVDVRDSSCAIASKRSSQYGMVMEMPFDLVAEVRCFFGARLRELEGELQDAVDAVAREDRLLHHDLAVGALEHAAADGRVLALGVLAHDAEVDVARLAAGERRAARPASAAPGAG